MQGLQFATVRNLANHFRSMGFLVYTKSKNAISVSVHVIDTDCDDTDLDFDVVDATFTGDTPQEMYDQYLTWIGDKSIWIEKNRVAIFNNHTSIYDFDLAGELLQLGFKYVEVEHEDSNFVQILCKYCYVEEGDDKFKFDGDFYFDNIGDKFQTLEFVKNWIKEHSEFKPTNSLYSLV